MSFEDLIDYMIRKGYSRLIIIQSKKGNPSRIIFYQLDMDSLKKVFEMLISGLSLQVDKKIKQKFSELEIKADDNQESQNLRKIFTEFFGSDYIIDPKKDGERGVLYIKYDKDLTIEFINSNNKITCPKIRVRRWSVDTKG